MHTLHARSADEALDETLLSERASAAAPFVRERGGRLPAAPSSEYRPARLDWRALVAVAALHVALGVVLIRTQVIPPHAVQSAMDLLDLSAPPPAAEAPPPPDLAEPEIYVPPPAVEIARPSPPLIMATAELPQPQPPAPVAIKAETAPRPAAPQTLVSDDLGATMISAKPPTYPLESRRKHEQGTVVLLLTLGTDGRVADIRVTKSSGHERLDRAALSAVRHWRWSPTTRDGAPVAVRGTVEIPFVLQG